MYDGPTRNATSATTITTTVVNRKPIIDSPRWLTAVMRPPPGVTGDPRSMDGGTDTLELERRDVVPVEPDEESLAAEVGVRDKAPVPTVVAVVAVVAHHEVVPGRDAALEAVLIVIAVFAPRERSHVAGIDGQRLGIDGDRMPLRRDAVGELHPLLQRFEAQSLEVAVAVVGLLRPRNPVHRELLVAVLDDVAGDPDHPLDEVLRRVERVLEHDDVPALRVGERDHLAVEDREADPVDELVDEDEIADGERRPHRRRQDLERLDDERAQQEHGEQHRKERLRVLDPDLLTRTGSARRGEEQAVDEPCRTRDHGQHEEQQGKVHRNQVVFGWISRTADGRPRGGRAIVSWETGLTCCPPAARPGTPPAGSRRCRPPSSASCPPSASRAASSCGL